LHEVGIASSILETLVVEARRRPDSQIIAVGLRIGELSNIDKDALSFAFNALTRNTAWQNLKIEIEWRPRRQKCLACSEEFSVKDYQLDCPNCGETSTACISGLELDIAYMEVEDVCAK
jgi:hydrogenase nickel incorporation protein HypA/HybF